jgi:hypothetical protein
MHYWFEFAVETPFGFDVIEQLQVFDNSCKIQRGEGEASRTFFGLNSFVTPPTESQAEILNEFDFANQRIADCSRVNDNLQVNVYYVDFWSAGDLPRVQQEHNKALGNNNSRQRKMIRTAK